MNPAQRQKRKYFLRKVQSLPKGLCADNGVFVLLDTEVKHYLAARRGFTNQLNQVLRRRDLPTGKTGEPVQLREYMLTQIHSVMETFTVVNTVCLVTVKGNDEMVIMKMNLRRAEG